MYRGLNEIIPVGIGERIDNLMYEKDVNCVELAKALHIHRKTIYRILGGFYPSATTTIAMSEYFGCSTDYILKGVK